ncbi:MAG: cyclic nucleotide-binding domain-containing protein, partial [Deltaproteobacteria bacterium]|nr:cyclic nucleotide-binding domain-containing protein [Deltaproteobacteria bacterium]
PERWRAEAADVARKLREEIAGTFGKGSARAAEVPPAPPSLPPPPASTEMHKDLAGDALLDRLESIVLEIACEPDPFDEDARVPRLPLFGHLPPDALARLLEALVVRDVGRGETVVREGDAGREAFVVARGRLSASKVDRGQVVPLAELGPGAIFGEMALVTESPRGATVVAAIESTLLVVERGPLERLARDVPALATELGAFCRDRLVANVATFAPCLRAMPDEERIRLLTSCTERLLDRGETLLHIGEEVGAMYLVATGSLEAVAGEGTDKTLVGRIGPGDVAGVTSFVLRRPSSMRVRAVAPSTVFVLPFEVFRTVAERWPAMLWWLWEVAIVRSDRLSALLAQEATDVGDVPIG